MLPSKPRPAARGDEVDKPMEKTSVDLFKVTNKDYIAVKDRVTGKVSFAPERETNVIKALGNANHEYGCTESKGNAESAVRTAKYIILKSHKGARKARFAWNNRPPKVKGRTARTSLCSEGSCVLIYHYRSHPGLGNASRGRKPKGPSSEGQWWSRIRSRSDGFA